MDVTETRLKEGTENEYEDYIEEKAVNSMVPIWRKNKNELTVMKIIIISIMKNIMDLINH